jgi:hypothetical protein
MVLLFRAAAFCLLHFPYGFSLPKNRHHLDIFMNTATFKVHCDQTVICIVRGGICTTEKRPV